MIIWIHGFPLSSRIFEPQKSFPGFAPDLPGFGSAAPPLPDMTMDDYARAVLAQMDREKIDRAIFAGLSMGGYICFALARIAPERMTGLILIDTRETPDNAEGKKGRYETIEKVKEKGVSVVVDSMLPKMLTPSAPPELVSEARKIMMSSSPAGVTAALKAMAERPDSTETLRAITVPTLIVVGDSDTITPPSDAERMASLAPNATLAVIAGAAHLSNLEQPDQFNHAVESFLAL
jgi:pimeloyl-ACP methyl ester carboxylesterase